MLKDLGEREERRELQGFGPKQLVGKWGRKGFPQRCFQEFSCRCAKVEVSIRYPAAKGVSLEVRGEGQAGSINRDSPM